MSIQLKAYVKRGANAGVELTPHLNKEGFYIASMTRFEKDYVRVSSTAELAKLVKEGLSIRMSAPGVAPSLISPASITALGAE